MYFDSHSVLVLVFLFLSHTLVQQQSPEHKMVRMPVKTNEACYSIRLCYTGSLPERSSYLVQ